MHFKREISTSVSDLHLNSVSDSIKRLAISHDGLPQKAMNITNPDAMAHQFGSILTVMSKAQDDFGSKYDVIREIGKGGFSTVYQCKDKRTNLDYAVKIVDLRPLRLRERFNPARLRREVDIMKRLHHPNIIEFKDVFEDNDNLMMIMEYCPGRELFDVILERKYFEEDEARPIFSQIARALYYLHSLNILHRDVKPENVLISSIPDARTGNVVAKLLDFGLSKNAGNGSAAKTFVGTPCYVAPEVEYTSKGLGGTYSFPADCWSLGALLYVMLVARFPEFEQDATGKVVVKLAPALWGNVSVEAKDLIRALMNTNPAARLSMASTLMHPWLQRYRATQEELSKVSVSSYDLNRQLQEEEARLEAIEVAKRTKRSKPSSGTTKLNSVGEMDYNNDPDAEMTASGVIVHQQAMVVRGGGSDLIAKPSGEPGSLQLAPLLHLQRSIATCFDEVHASYKDLPEVASEIRQGATLCREQLTESMKMLRKVEQTAAAVLAMFPDLELAVEEGEPQLASDFFAMVKGWVTELRELVKSTQSINKASMLQIQLICERSAIGLLAQQKERQQHRSNNINVPKKLLDTVMVKLGLTDRFMIENGDTVKGDAAVDAIVELDANHILDLFMSLFGPSNGNGQGQAARPGSNGILPDPTFGRVYSIDSDTQSINSNNSGRDSTVSSQPSLPVLSKQDSMASTSSISSPAVVAAAMNALRGAAATSAALYRTASQNSRGLASDDGSISEPRGGYGSIGEETEPSTPITPSEGATPRVNPADLQNSETYAMDLDEDVERNDSYGSTISLDPFTPLPNGLPIPVPGPPAAAGAKHLPAHIKLALPPVPGAAPDAAAHLAEALKKLRQVDEILEELSVFWANTEVVLDLLTKKGQHVEQFIGFASKPKLMARFLERMEEYKRFWENVSMMCSNYIAGVQTTNDTQRMYGFLDPDSSSTLSSKAASSSASTPPHYVKPNFHQASFTMSVQAIRPGSGAPSEASSSGQRTYRATPVKTPPKIVTPVGGVKNA